MTRFLNSRKSKPKLTILTDPIPLGLVGVGEYLRRNLRWIYRAVASRSLTRASGYGGHSAVTRSVVEGLTKIGAEFTYNPTTLGRLAESVHVLAGVKTLRQMVELRRRGVIRRLTAGPNIVVFSSDANSILASPEIDAVVNHCAFACQLWAEDHPDLLNKCLSWPAGVDTQFWAPAQPTVDRGTILVFDKRRLEDDPHRISPYVDYLRNQGWQVEVLTRFGSLGYTPEQYRSMLQRSALMVGFTVGSESQGIAWAEAWSCDVPTLILRNTVNAYMGRTFNCSTAPYLTETTGLFFDGLEHFKSQLAYWRTHRERFHPRAWVMEHMSDEVSARILYRHITGESI